MAWASNLNEGGAAQTTIGIGVSCAGTTSSSSVPARFMTVFTTMCDTELVKCFQKSIVAILHHIFSDDGFTSGGQQTSFVFTPHM